MAIRRILPRGVQPVEFCLRHALAAIEQIEGLAEGELAERWRRLRCVRQWLAAGVVGIESVLVDVEQRLATAETLNEPLTSSGEMPTMLDACPDGKVES